MTKPAKRSKQKERNAKAVNGSEVEDLRRQLRDVIMKLYLIHSAITVSVGCLKHQSVEYDRDVASVLQRSVANRLMDQIESIALLAGSSIDDNSLDPTNF